MVTWKHDSVIVSADSKIHRAMVVLPILLLLLGSSPTSFAAEEEHQLTDLDVSLLEPQHVSCLGHRVMPPLNGSWVPLFRPLGPCSPSFNAAAAAARAKPSLADVLRQDRLRVHHIHSRVSGGSRGARASKGSFKEPATVEETQLHHQAAINVEVGTARTSSEPSSSSSIHPAATDGSSSPQVTVVLDTAGDVPWMRCLPCTFTQCADYDPTRSSTYKAFPCNSTECKQLGRYANGCDANGQCQYIVAGDEFTTSGTYSSDVLTINSANPVKEFKFGCSQNEQGTFENQARGIMALGRGVQSLMAQTSSTYGDAFSYCLPATDNIKGFFQIGVPIEASYRFVTTPMLKERGPPSTLYRVLLVAITVDGKALNVPPEVFAAGTVMQSRTLFTRLPVTAYGALRAAFRNKMMYRAAPPQDELDTCYDLTGVRYPRLPRIALVFDGNAVVELDRSGILYNGCLAFASNDDDSSASILGNVQQKTIQVLHDVGGGRMGFRSAAC